MWSKVGTVIAVVLIVGSWAIMAKQAIDCSDSGGTLVRGVFLFECIQTTPVKEPS